MDKQILAFHINGPNVLRKTNNFLFQTFFSFIPHFNYVLTRFYFIPVLLFFLLHGRSIYIQLNELSKMVLALYLQDTVHMGRSWFTSSELRKYLFKFIFILWMQNVARSSKRRRKVILKEMCLFFLAFCLLYFPTASCVQVRVRSSTGMFTVYILTLTQ